MITELLVLLGVLGIAGYQLLKKVRTDIKYSNSISAPPPTPEVTPTIVQRGVIVGEATYFDINIPEATVNVISVDDAAEVKFELFDGSIRYLPVSDFLLRYAPRQVTRISRIK